MVAKADGIGSSTAVGLISEAAGATTAAAPAEVAAKPTPGFGVDGKPLDDGNVWGARIGSTRRGLDTSDGIDGWEMKKLYQVFKKEGFQAFAQRLFADSSNGTPVQYAITKEMRDGVGTASFKIENGHLEGTASLEFYNNKSDRWLKAYLARSPRDKGTRATLTFNVKGDVNKDGGIDNIALDGAASNLPRLSADKLLKINKLLKDLSASYDAHAALAKDPKATKKALKESKKDALYDVERAVERLKEFPLHFILAAMNEDERFRGNLSVAIKGVDPKLSFKGGKGSLELGLRDFIGKPSEGEPDLRATLKAHTLRGKDGAEDFDTLAVDQIAVYTAEKLSMTYDESGKPQLNRIGKDGKPEKIRDHVAELMMFVPALLAGGLPW